MWCIPPPPPKQDGALVARMERLLQLYSQPYDPRASPSCVWTNSRISCCPRPGSRGRRLRVGPSRVDYEYTREGCCTVWMFVEPLGQWREVGVSSRRTASDWAARIRSLVDAPPGSGLRNRSPWSATT